MMHKPNSKASLSYWHMRRIASIYQHPFHTGIHTGIQTSIKVTSFSFIAANAAIASAYTKGIREAKVQKRRRRCKMFGGVLVTAGLHPL